MQSEDVDAFVRRLRQRLDESQWKSSLLERTASLRGKVEDARKKNVKLSKGTGGNVSAVRKTMSRLDRLALVLRCASVQSGAALIHGSVALTAYIEQSKDSIEELRKQSREYRGVNIQNHPFVDLGKNCTVEAYTLWHDYRLGLAAERYVTQAHGDAAPPPKKKQRKVPTDKELRNEVLVVKRALMRKDVLSTLIFDLNDDSPLVEEFASKQVRFCAMTYRPMPDDIEREIRSSGMTAQRVLDIVQNGRRKYESYFTTNNEASHARRVRSVPSKQMKNYFDREKYVEEKLLHRIYHACDESLLDSDAVSAVFNTERQGDENFCQRAFAHWFLDELKSVFGTVFVDTYKSGIRRAMRVCKAQVLILFGALHKSVLDVYLDYCATLEVTTKSKSRQKSSATPPQNDALRAAMEKPISAAFEKSEKHTRLQMLSAERTRKRRAALGLSSVDALQPTASCWRQPFESSIAATAPLPPTAVAHAVKLAEPCMRALATISLRRTESEVMVGESINQVATNATDARVSARTHQSMRDVGGASRRMLAAHATKPFPCKDYIQHTQNNGLLEEQNERRKLSERFEEPLRFEQTLDANSMRRRAQLLVSEFDSEQMPASEHAVFEQCTTGEECLQMVYASGDGLCVEAAHGVCAALLQSRTPARTAAETNNALLDSDAVCRIVSNFASKCMQVYAFMASGTTVGTLRQSVQRHETLRKRKRL